MTPCYSFFKFLVSLIYTCYGFRDGFSSSWMWVRIVCVFLCFLHEFASKENFLSIAIPKGTWKCEHPRLQKKGKLRYSIIFFLEGVETQECIQGKEEAEAKRRQSDVNCRCFNNLPHLQTQAFLFMPLNFRLVGPSLALTLSSFASHRNSTECLTCVWHPYLFSSCEKHSPLLH